MADSEGEQTPGWGQCHLYGVDGQVVSKDDKNLNKCYRLNNSEQVQQQTRYPLLPLGTCMI